MSSPVPSCPVCGHRYRGTLETHLDAKLPDSGLDGITRCDWNMIQHRVMRRVKQLREAGWIPAGPSTARIVMQLQPEYPHLAQLCTSGSVSNVPHDEFIDPAKDYKAWWTRPWVRHIAELQELPCGLRLQVIAEFDARGTTPPADLVEAAHRCGGRAAVAVMLVGADGLLPVRCGGSQSLQRQSGAGTIRDHCVLPTGHAGQHKGTQTRRFWG